MSISDKNISHMNADEKHYVIDYTDKVSAAFITTANTMYAQANTVIENLTSQLILINTVFFSGSLLFFSSKDVINKVKTVDGLKWLLVSVFILQLLSIILGLISYKNREKFFAEAGDIEKNIGHMIKDRKYKTLNEMERKIDEMRSQKTRSREIAQILQLSSIPLTMVAFFAFIFLYIFN